MFQDNRGIRFAVGDTVVWSSMDNAGVIIGTIVGFTPKKVRICQLNTPPEYSRLKDPSFLLRVELPDA